MDQFDKLIKDKINSKDYDYRPKAWKTFKRQSGMPMMSVGAKLAVTAAAVVLVGGVLYFTLVSSPGPQEATTIVCKEQKTDNQQVDTIELAENVVPENVSEETVASACPTLVSSPSVPKHQNTQKTEETSATNTETLQSRQPKHISKTIYYRPSEILVDTISSIDFPDYETKPAEMLP
ncbi:MAG: hypothetical protein J5644_06770 [Bacteroidales bacterium]|nr:hypothetical protein [Bacteroidales bacterium]